MKKILATIFLVSFLLPNFATADITSNLVGWWKFDEGTGTTATDSNVTISPNDGAHEGDPVYTDPGKVGPYDLFFDSIDDRVQIPDFDEASPLINLSVSAWVKSTSTDIVITAPIFSKQRSTTGFSGWALTKDTDEKFRFQIRNTGSGTTTAQISAISDSGYADTDWHHLVGVYDGVNLRLYVDGLEADSTPPATTIHLVNDTRPVCVAATQASGDDCIATGSMLFGGDVDDARIYNRALSADDVAELYLYTEGGATPPIDDDRPIIME